MKRQGMGRVGKVAVAAALLCAAALGGVRVWSHGQRVDLRLSCTPGATHAYALEYFSKGALHETGMPLGGARKVEASVRGRMTETCLANDEDGMRMSVTFEGLSGGFRSDDGPEDAASSILRGESFVHVDHDGSVGSITFASELSDVGRNLFRDVLSLRSTRLALAARVGGAWEAREEDLYGTYRSGYALAAATRSQATVTKDRRDYGASESALRETAPRPVLTGDNRSTIVLDRERHAFESVDARVNVEVRAGTKALASTTARLSLQTIGYGTRSDVARLVAAYSEASSSNPAADLAAHEADARLDQRTQRDELGEDTWDTLLARANGGDVAAKTYLKLRALFRLHPETCVLAGRELVKKAKADEGSFMVLVSSLSASGVPEAQRAMAGAARELTGDAQLVVVASLGDARAPTVDTEAALRRWAEEAPTEDVGRTARLALGSIARDVRASTPERTQRIEADALRAVSEASSPDERALALAVLGNIGSDRGLGPARDALLSPDVSLRTAAVSSLRFVEMPEAEELLVKAAATDVDRAVRLQALAALAFRKLAPPSVEVLRARVTMEIAANVRLAIVGILGNEAERYPELLAILQQVAAGDAVSNVRDAAGLAVLRLQAAGM